MTTSLRRSRMVALMIALSAAIAGCAPLAGPDTSASATPSPSPSASTSASADGPRYVIECVDPDGGEVGAFTRLEEAWASTNYLRIDHCAAMSATGSALELTAEEEAIARTAAADLPDEDPADLFLMTLATCVRVTATSAEPLAALPTSLLQAALELCPEAPHAGLMEDELQTRSP
jgi:hypothetical protein